MKEERYWRKPTEVEPWDDARARSANSEPLTLLPLLPRDRSLRVNYTLCGWLKRLSGSVLVYLRHGDSSTPVCAAPRVRLRRRSSVRSLRVNCTLCGWLGSSDSVFVRSCLSVVPLRVFDSGSPLPLRRGCACQLHFARLTSRTSSSHVPTLRDVDMVPEVLQHHHLFECAVFFAITVCCHKSGTGVEFEMGVGCCR